MVLNKVLPSYLLDAERRRGGRAAVHGADRAWPRGSPTAVGCDPTLVARVLAEVGESFLRFQLVAQREAEQRAELAVSPEVVATVPYFETDIHDLAGLLRLGEQIWSCAASSLWVWPDRLSILTSRRTPRPTPRRPPRTCWRSLRRHEAEGPMAAG